MKRTVISLLISMPLAIHAAGDRKVAYFNDMANPIEIYIKPELASASDLSLRVEPQKFTEVTIPGGKIAELTIAERDPSGKLNSEKLYAREGSGINKLSPKYGHDATLNKDERYVIVHNRINPLRVFRLLNPRDVDVRKTVKETAQAGGAVVGAGLEAAGQGALFFLTVAVLGGK